MAIPTFVDDLTVIDAADSTTGWVAIDGAMFSTADGLQGTACIFVEYKNADSDGAAFTLSSTVDFTIERLYIWIKVQEAVFLDTFANGGVYIQMSSDASDPNLNYDRWYVGGSDSDWVKSGAWRRIVFDANRTPDVTVGSPSLTAVKFVGAGHTATTTSMGAGTKIDILHRGTKFEVTGPTHTGSSDLDFNDNGGSDDTIVRAAGSFLTDGYEVGDTIDVTGTSTVNGAYIIKSLVALTITLETGSLPADEQNTSGTVMAGVKFQDIVDKDESDDTFIGAVTKTRSGIFEINGTVFIGDESGSGDIFFESKNESILFPDMPTTTTGSKLTAIQDTGLTKVVIGNSSGTGESKVGFEGSSFNAINTDFAVDHAIDFSDTIDRLEVYGTTFQNLSGGASFAADTSHDLIDCQFKTVGQVDLGSIFARNLIFSGYSPATNGALLWNGSIDIKRSKFLANANLTDDSHAIEHPAQGTFTYDALEFASNDFDIHYTAAASSGILTINANNGSNPVTSDILNATGNSVVIINTVTVSVTCQDDIGTVIENAIVLLTAKDNTDDLPFEESVSIVSTALVATVTHTAHGIPDGQRVLIDGANEGAYNGVFVITLVDVNSYTYTMLSDPASPATGTILATGVVLFGTTNVSGVIENTGWPFTNPQEIIGDAKKGSAFPVFAPSLISGTIIMGTGFSTTSTMIDD